MASPTVNKTSGKPRRKRRWLQFGLPTFEKLFPLSLEPFLRSGPML
jgi:hypothetical protein